MNIEKIAKKIISSEMIKISQNDKVNDGYNEIYLVSQHGNNKFYAAYDYDTGWYWIVDNNGKYVVNFIKDLYRQDLFNGIDKNDLFDKLTICNNAPSFIQDFIDEQNENISFYDLLDIIQKYKFEYIGDREVSKGSQNGLRIELQGNGDYDAMLNEIKKNCKFPDKIIAGGEGHNKYAPEQKRKSIIIIY